ncbi:uncharacterized protein LOC131155720 [Malania oleifera]|uniref:uncharacterized protein LOC131155720 n=1 Tax=Malania oleifera TaxID=397392 RepID=UPI0025AE9304|nr:uncharacterized protein LOC131155720 [Malania oleifera]
MNAPAAMAQGPSKDDAEQRLARESELYNALMMGEEDKVVIEMCKRIPEGPFHSLTVHHDTVLHVATYSKRSDLVIRLLQKFADGADPALLTLQNDVGNTVLHEVATTRAAAAAEIMLAKAPKLLRVANLLGETALFRAVRYGKNEMFEFLAARVAEAAAEKNGEFDLRRHLQRADRTTILHMAILAEHFDLAYLIASKYEYLIEEEDGDRMTSLQLLACNAKAFKSSMKQGFLKQLIYTRVSTDDPTQRNNKGPSTQVNKWKSVKSCCKLPMLEVIRKEKQRHDSALRLAKLLIAKDKSWEKTSPLIDWSKPRTHKFGKVPTGGPIKVAETMSSVNASPTKGEGFSNPMHHSPTQLQYKEEEEEEEEEEGSGQSSIVRNGNSALILATRSGCVEIVEEILTKYPQAVEHINAKGRNVLHVAIRHRQVKVLDLLERMETRMRRLIRKIDNQGNSILHMVGMKMKEHMEENTQSPALQLQQELHLFERVKQISTVHFIKHYNSNEQTAEELFIANKKDLHKEAREWLKRTSENCIIVAVLMATVAFAAAYTIPGGPNQSTGLPILLYQPFFVVFTLTDVLSLMFSLTSVITFLSILTSPIRLQDFKQSLPQKLMLGFTFLLLSVSMMMVAFAATVILMIRNKERWTKIALYSMAFLPVTIFVLSYLPLYLSLMKTFMYMVRKIGDACPRFDHIPIPNFIFNLFKCRKPQFPTISSKHQHSQTNSTQLSSPKMNPV